MLSTVKRTTAGGTSGAAAVGEVTGALARSLLICALCFACISFRLAVFRVRWDLCWIEGSDFGAVRVRGWHSWHTAGG